MASLRNFQFENRLSIELTKGEFVEFLDSLSILGMENFPFFKELFSIDFLSSVQRKIVTSEQFYEGSIPNDCIQPQLWIHLATRERVALLHALGMWFIKWCRSI